MIQKLKDLLIDIFDFRYWYQQNPYNKEWDKILKTLLDIYEFENVTKYTAELGGVQIWVSNHPYSSFTPYDNFPRGIRASRKTIKLAKQKLDHTHYVALNEKIKNYEKQNS